MNMPDNASFDDHRPTDSVPEEQVVTVRYAGGVYNLTFESGKSVSYYLRTADGSIGTGLFGTGFASRHTASIDGVRTDMRAIVHGPCIITVNSRVRNG